MKLNTHLNKHSPKLHALVFLLAFAVAITPHTFAAQPALSEAQVFEWWDNGIIDGDEAREILDLLEEGNEQEACLLAEVYALNICQTFPEENDEGEILPGTNKEMNRSLVPHGYIEWRGRTDSLGELESERTELQVKFYRYTLRLGTQSLLYYKNDKSEAYFGEISTKELHSLIPLDTLWGTSLLYPLWKGRVGALLDTGKTSRLSLEYLPTRKSSLPQAELAYWSDKSFSIQAKTNFGGIAAWWPTVHSNLETPLIKLQLHSREKKRKKKVLVLWKTTAYFHGDTIPAQARLSASILKNRFWGSQGIGIHFSDSWNSRASANARITIPLENDSSDGRFKLSLESGPTRLRGGANATCLSAKENCRENDIVLKASSGWEIIDREKLTFFSGLRIRHTRGDGFGQPQTELGTLYTVTEANKIQFAAVFPQNRPTQHTQLRSEAAIGTAFLKVNLAVTFRRKGETGFRPLHAAIKAKAMF